MIDALAARDPDGPAFLEGERVVSWREYAAGSEALAAGLVRAGLGRGERLAVLLPDTSSFHVALGAAERAGLLAVGIGARSGPREVEHVVRKTGAAALLSADAGAAALEEVVERLRAPRGPLRAWIRARDDGDLRAGLLLDGSPLDLSRPDASLEAALAARRLGRDEPWLLNSTSGTTGLPKCVLHDQARWFAFHDFAVAAGALSGEDVFASLVPAPFGFGLWTAHFTPALLGARVVVRRRFDAAAALREIARRGVTVLAAVTTQLLLMLAREEMDLLAGGRLRVVFTGGEPVPADRAREFEERSGARVLQFYGSNEVGAVSVTTLADPAEKRLGTAGRPIPEMRLRLFDEQGREATARRRGQPGCKGPTLSLGYWEDDEANRELVREDGWMLLGDLVSIDEDGYLVVEGRVADFILRGGKNVSARQVEEAVARHPDVRRAAAVALPDATFGERVCVYVEPRPGARPRLAEIVAFLERGGVSKDLFPEALVVVAELPESAGGKVAKRRLREELERHRAAGRLELAAHVEAAPSGR